MLKLERKTYYEKNKEKLKEIRDKKKDEKKAYDKLYRKTDDGKKIRRISNWRLRGLICDDVDAIYNIYINTENCEECDIELVEGMFGANKKCLDHDHLTGFYRNTICQTCNLKRK
jgi:hypothetical protein